MISVLDAVAEREFDQCQFGRHVFALFLVKVIAGHHKNRIRTNACQNWIPREYTNFVLHFPTQRHLPIGTVWCISNSWMRSIIFCSSFRNSFRTRSSSEIGTPCDVLLAAVFCSHFGCKPFALALYVSRCPSLNPCMRKLQKEKNEHVL